MNKRLATLFISCALLPSISLADINISAGDGVKILAINGEAIDAGTFFSAAPELTAHNGKAQIVAEYTAEITESADEYQLEKSDTFVLTFTAENTAIRIHAPEISNRYSLKAFNSTGNWQLQDAAGKSVPFVFGKLEKEGFQLVRDYEKEVKEFNNSTADAAVSELNIETHSFNQGRATYPAESNFHPDQKMVGQMLQYWYEQANTETRNKFKSWTESSH